MKVAVIGHRLVEVNDIVKLEILRQIAELAEEGADRFCFTFGGTLTDICLNAIAELKQSYDIKRVYYRAIYPDDKDPVGNYILNLFGQEYFDEVVGKVGVDAVNKRDRFMIDDCDVLLTLYDPKIKNSATACAVAYAKKKGKRIINVLDLVK